MEIKQGEKTQCSQVLSNAYVVLFQCPSTRDGILTLSKNNDTLKFDKPLLFSGKQKLEIFDCFYNSSNYLVLDTQNTL